MKPSVYTIRGPWKGRLAIVGRPRGNEWLEDEIEDIAREDFHVIVSLLTVDECHELGLSREAEIAAGSKLNFISFPIADYSVPTSTEATLDVVLKIDEMLRRGLSVAVHCRAGIGRSSLIAACLLSLSGSVDDSFAEIAKARGAAVPDTVEQRDWVRRFVRANSSPIVSS